MKRLITICVVMMLCLCVSQASLGAVLVDRGLPVYNSTNPNLNYDAGANRSNVSWGELPDSPQLMDGDDFTLPSLASGSYKITTIRTWLVNGVDDPDRRPDYAYATPSDIYQNVSLYLGPKNGTLSVVSSGNFTGGANTDNLNISIKEVKYSNGAEYETSSGSPYRIWEVNFNNLNLVYAAGSQLSFAVFGLGNAAVTDPYDQVWYNHASNAALSNSPQDGADDLFSIWKVADGTLDTAGVNAYTEGWDDKPSDINVQVLGVPEPATICLLGFGALSLLRRKRQ